MILLIDNYDSFSYNLYQYLGELVDELGSEPAGEPGEAPGGMLGKVSADMLEKVTAGEPGTASGDALGEAPDDEPAGEPAREPGGESGRMPAGKPARNLEREIRVVRNDAIDAAGIRELAPEHIVISPGPGYPAEAGNCVDIVRELSGTIPILGVCLGHQAICEAFGGRIVHARELMHGKQSRVALDPSCALFAGLPPEADVARYHSLAVDAGTLPCCLRVVARAPDGEAMAVEHVVHPTFGVQFHPESIMTPDGKTMLRNFLRL